MTSLNLNLIYGLAGAMILVGLVFIYLLIGRGGLRWPRAPMEWLGTGVTFLLIFCASMLFWMGLRVQGQEDIIAVQGVSQIEDIALSVPAEDFSVRLVGDNSPTALNAYAGKVVVLNFWATWCAPCLQEIPELNRLHEEMQDEGVVVLSVSDEPRELLQAFHDQLPLETVSAYLMDPSDLPEAYKKGFDVRPTTFIIDRQGTIRRYLLGARSYAFFKQAVTPYL